MTDEINSMSLAEPGEFSDVVEEPTPVTGEVEAEAEVTANAEEAGDGATAVSDPAESATAQEAAPESEAAPEDPAIAELRQQAEAWERFQKYMEGLTPEQQQAALVALGLADPEPEVPQIPEDYEPQGALEEALAPFVPQIAELTQSLPKWQSQVGDVFNAHAQVLDTVAVENAYLREALSVIAEQAGVKLPDFDAAKTLEAVKGGTDYKAHIAEQFKGVKEHQAAIREREEKKASGKIPNGVGNSSGRSNGVNSERLYDYFLAATPGE